MAGTDMDLQDVAAVPDPASASSSAPASPTASPRTATPAGVVLGDAASNLVRSVSEGDSGCSTQNEDRDDAADTSSRCYYGSICRRSSGSSGSSCICSGVVCEAGAGAVHLMRSPFQTNESLNFTGAISVKNSTNVHFGNVINCPSPVTLLVAASTEGIGDLLPDADLATAAPTVRDVYRGTQKRASTSTPSPWSPEKIAGWSLKKFLHWPRVTIPVGGLAAVVAVLLTLTFLLWPRQEGLPRWTHLVPRDGWLARPQKGIPDTLKTPVTTVLLHHSDTATCLNLTQCIERLRSIQQQQMDSLRTRLFDISFNFMVGGDGLVYEGRGWDAVGAHLDGWNTDSLGVCLVGFFTYEAPTAAQMAALAGLLRWGVKLGKVVASYKLVGACQVRHSNSPGLRVMDTIRSWAHWWPYEYGQGACSAE